MKNWLIIRPLNAGIYALSGLKTALAGERAFQQEAIVFIILLIAVTSSGVDFYSGVLLLLSWTVVTAISKMINTIASC